MADDKQNESSAKPWDRPSKIAVVMLIVGLATSVAVYLTAAPDEDDPLHDFEQTKKYFADVERAGGKTALFSAELSRWFSGLWHGQSLAFTIAILTTVAAVGYVFVARRLASLD